MRKTTKKHWVNGHQVRGKGFHTLTLSIGSLGLMLSNNGISFYRLTSNE